MDDKPSSSKLFNAYYYAHDCGEPYMRNDVWLSRFDTFAERISLDIQPTTVLDAGCALGLLVEVLRKRGVQAWGIDISEFAIQNVHPDIRPFCNVGSITEPFELPHYDLIVSIEVLEHMPKEEADKAIANLCNHTDDILFSSTPYNYNEATHFNVQPTEYWVECFARHGYFRDVDFDASFITTWAIRFRRQKLSPSRLARNYERRFMPLLLENIVLRNEVINNRHQLEILEGQIAETEQEVESLSIQLKQARDRPEPSEQRISELEQANSDSINQLADLFAQLRTCIARTDELSQANAATALELTEERGQLEAARNRLIQLEQQLYTASSHLTNIQNNRWYKLAKKLKSALKPNKPS
jgi:SAM-dependent methyltransferase